MGRPSFFGGPKAWNLPYMASHMRHHASYMPFLKTVSFNEGLRHFLHLHIHELLASYIVPVIIIFQQQAHRWKQFSLHA